MTHPAPEALPPEPGEKWRHKQRGTVYEVLSTTACLQCSTAPPVERMFEEDHFTVYRSVLNPMAIYIRPTAEFNDGRFERADNT